MKPGIEHTALYSYFNASMRPTEILSELLDNAFDSGADAIHVDLTPDGLAVCDNGAGIEDMEKMFRIGASGRHSDPTAIGRYGVGGKHALLAVGSVFDIATRVGGKCIEAKVNWMKFARLGFEQISDPLPVPVDRLRKDNYLALSAGWNTRVAVLKKHKRRSMTGVNSILKQLALRYRPALMEGARITLAAGGEVHDLQDQPYADPKIIDIVEEGISVQGKKARVRAGRTEKHIPGMTGRALISYGPRVIETPTDLGDTNIHSQIYVEVNLGIEWRDSLATHKDVVLEDRDELLAEIARIIDPLTKHLNAMQKEWRFELICEGLGNKFQDAVKQIRQEGKAQVRRDSFGSNPVIAPESDHGPGAGPEPNPDRPLAHIGVVEEGDHEVEDIQVEAPDSFKVSFSVREVKELVYHCRVNSTISRTDASIYVDINTSIEIVEKAFSDNGDALLLMVAHALAEHFADVQCEPNAKVLFPGVLEDLVATEAAQFDTRAAKLASTIIRNLSAMDQIKDSDLEL